MDIANSFSVFSRIALLPDYLCNKVLPSKQLIAQNTHVRLLRIIDANPNTSWRRKQIPQNTQSFSH